MQHVKKFLAICSKHRAQLFTSQSFPKQTKTRRPSPRNIWSSTLTESNWKATKIATEEICTQRFDDEALTPAKLIATDSYQHLQQRGSYIGIYVWFQLQSGGPRQVNHHQFLHPLFLLGLYCLILCLHSSVLLTPKKLLIFLIKNYIIVLYFCREIIGSRQVLKVLLRI